MVHEINASEIMAFLVNKSEAKQVRIEIKEVVSIGCKVESLHPSVFVDTDKYSFHSFASISNKSIKIEGTEIVVDKTDRNLSNRLERMLPTFVVRKYIEEIIG